MLWRTNCNHHGIWWLQAFCLADHCICLLLFKEVRTAIEFVFCYHLLLIQALDSILWASWDKNLGQNLFLRWGYRLLMPHGWWRRHHRCQVWLRGATSWWGWIILVVFKRFVLPVVAIEWWCLYLVLVCLFFILFYIFFFLLVCGHSQQCNLKIKFAFWR